MCSRDFLIDHEIDECHKVLNFERYNQIRHNFKFYNNVLIFRTTTFRIEPVFQ